jgi:PleD family two-component response regulator
VREATHAAAVADKVLVAARDSYPVGPLRLSLGASVGVAFTSAANPCWRALLALADARLLLAKAAGKGCQSGATL